MYAVANIFSPWSCLDALLPVTVFPFFLTLMLHYSPKTTQTFQYNLVNKLMDKIKER